LQIFIINGNAKSGKTTFGEYVGKILEKTNIPFLHDSSINPVKEYLKENGWEEKTWDGVTKDDFWRRAMYECKCMMLESDKHIFDKYALEKLYNLSKDGERAKQSVLFYDIREPENIQQLVDFVNENDPEIDIKTIFIEREVEEIFNNYADKNQTNMEYDIRVDNNRGLRELLGASEEFVKEYIMEEWINESKKEKEHTCY
jgi:thiol-disulfide isomerase/thioredoxin